MQTIAEVLTFWFSEKSRRQWLAPTPEFDQEIREHCADLSARAAMGELSAWEETPEGCLALCVLLDQMPRNMFRGTPRVYATDRRALEVAKRAVSRGFDRGLLPEQKQFLYLPFSHSERLADQERALPLFEAAGLDDALVYVRGHLAIIRRFGRFPHRNALLGRSSTPEERKFLAQDPEDYGQSVERSDRPGPSDPDRGAQDPAARTIAGR